MLRAQKELVIQTVLIASGRKYLLNMIHKYKQLPGLPMLKYTFVHGAVQFAMRIRYALKDNTALIYS